MFSYVIGLEIHVQLKTKSKMFCRCSNDGENQPPNTTVCPVCMGHPGTLPVANAQAIAWAAQTALALNCTVEPVSKFDRKNYFYPDLPKGYQISQYDQPIGRGGFFDLRIPLNGAPRDTAHIRMNRLHLEEDAAKLIHEPSSNASMVDFNRAGTPLMETVTEPDFISPAEAKLFLQELRLLVRYLGVSSGDMEKGHLRCDANISIRFNHDGSEVWTPISEIKNLNSFRSVERALEYEGARLYDEWLAGGVVRERKNKITVGWDEAQQKTFLQRGKEEAHDYRYFPEPDIPPLFFSDEELKRLRQEIPELPEAKRLRFSQQYGLPREDVRLLVEDRETAAFFERAASELDEWLSSIKNENSEGAGTKLLASWIINKLAPLLLAKNQTIEESKLTPENMAELVSLLMQKKINSTTAQTLLEEMLATGGDPSQMMEEKGLTQVHDEFALTSIVEMVLAANADAVEKYKAGKTNIIMFLVGAVMKEMKGTASPETTKALLEKMLTKG